METNSYDPHLGEMYPQTNVGPSFKANPDRLSRYPTYKPKYRINIKLGHVKLETKEVWESPDRCVGYGRKLTFNEAGVLTADTGWLPTGLVMTRDRKPKVTRFRRIVAFANKLLGLS